MNIAFVGSVLNADVQQRVVASSTAGNRYQLGLLLGVVELGAQVSVISMEPHAMWRRPGERLAVRGTRRFLSAGLPSRTVGYINLPGLKQVCIAVSTLAKLLQWRSRGWGGSDANVVLVYNSLSYQFWPCLMATKILGCRLGVVVADLPLGSSRAGLAGLLERAEHWLEVKSLRYADFLISLTQHTQGDLAGSRPSLVVEGGQEVESSHKPAEARPKRRPRQLVYAGSLNSVSGIALAIEAVGIIPPGEVVLNIYGDGTPEQVAEVQAAQSESIVFHGAVGHRTIVKVEYDADLLLSPRQPDAFVTRYTFPSKLIEYMASGAPVVSNSLPGIPDEYMAYINVPKSPTPELWAETIREICLDESGIYEARANAARTFICEQKTWNKQAARIIEFLRTEIFGAA